MKYIPPFLMLLALGLAAMAGYAYRAIERPTYEYQIECEMDSMYLYEGKRLVGSVPYDSCQLTELIINDNQ